MEARDMNADVNADLFWLLVAYEPFRQLLDGKFKDP